MPLEQFEREQLRTPAAQYIAELEAALRHIIGMAGNPNAANGCRLIINRAKQALGDT